jgi:long-subunit fatty acid transport protein
MNKILFLIIGVLSMSTIYAQNLSDAVRYSNDNVKGTARFRAMSGAFGALGGDMSAVSINPAGSAIFNNPHISFSLSNTNRDNTTSFLNTSNNTTDSSFDLNQIGAAFVFKNTNTDSPWRKFVLSLSYEQTQNFNDDFFSSGVNSNSIDSYFIQTTQNQDIPFGVLKLQDLGNGNIEYLEDAYADIGATFGYNHQQAFLGYWAGIIDPVNLDNDTNDDNIDYVSNIAPGTFNQRHAYTATGNNGKFSINGAVQHQKNLYLGINLNAHFIDYEKFTSFRETNNNQGSVVNNVIFENLLRTQGTGFSFQLGGIYKLSKHFRIGATYDSPVWYRIDEETVQNINSNNADDDIRFIADVINVFPQYKLQTPSKITGSAAIILGKTGLISFDYSRKDFSKTKFKPESDTHFANQNNIINASLKAADTYRIGGEYRHKELSLRAGYKIEESPYINDEIYGDLKGYSLGAGYNFGAFKLDLAYEHSKRDYNYQLYNVGLTDISRIDNKNSNITLTMSLNF